MRLLQLTQDTLLHLPNRALVLIILRMRYTPAVADSVGGGLNCPVRRHRKLLPGAGVLNGKGAVLPPAQPVKRISHAELHRRRRERLRPGLKNR